MSNYKKYPAFLKEISVQPLKAPFNFNTNKNSNFPPVSISQPFSTLQSSQSQYAVKTSNETKTNTIDPIQSQMYFKKSSQTSLLLKPTPKKHS